MSCKFEIKFNFGMHMLQSNQFFPYGFIKGIKVKLLSLVFPPPWSVPLQGCTYLNDLEMRN